MVFKEFNFINKLDCQKQAFEKITKNEILNSYSYNYIFNDTNSLFYDKNEGLLLFNQLKFIQVVKNQI